MINGNVEGIRKSYILDLENLFRIKTGREEVCSLQLIEEISRISNIIEKEISVAIDRKGKVTSIAVGDSTSVELPIIAIDQKRLSGSRVIHTHPSGRSNLSAMDISALIKLKLDAIIAIGLNEEGYSDFSIGTLMVHNDTLVPEEKNNISLNELISINFHDKITFIEGLIKKSDITEEEIEKAILVGTDTRESLSELKELADACDIPTLQVVFQSRDKIDAAFYIGKGKVAEIASIRQIEKANLIIFDDELSGSQVRNLENAIGAKVIDRTTLILEIFARRAKSKEAKIQVELAQLKYRKSRLQGLGTVLSRTGGGIGTKGPGEKKLETDRRKIDETIYDLNKELKKIKKIRDVQKGKRIKEGIPKVSLVGYTNAGKSTLRNILCEVGTPKDSIIKEKVFEADMLFATLDITTRAINLKNKGVVTITDTVGFVRKLPHDLVEAFKSTLEEVIDSDLLCHIVDASSKDALDQIDTVEEVLSELGAIDKPSILVLNKIDKASDEQIETIKQKVKNQIIIEISAKEEINIDSLLNLIEKKLPFKFKKAEFLIPYTDGDIVSMLHSKARVIEEEYKNEGTYLKVELDDKLFNKVKEYLING